MANELIFRFAGTEYGAAPVKTDFSRGHKEMIKRDMLYSNDEQYILELLAAEIADNVKKGWEEMV